MMSKLRTLLSGRTITGGVAEQLAQIRDELEEQEVALAELAGERQRAARSLVLGNPAAQDRIAALDEAAGERRRRIDDLRGAAAEIERQDREAKAQAEFQEASARPRRIAQLVAHSLDLDDEIMKIGAQLAAALEKKLATDKETATIANSITLDRTEQTSLGLIRSKLALLFWRDRGRPNNTAGNNLLDMKSSLLGPELETELRDRDRARFDDLVPFYASKSAASEAKARLADRGVAAALGELPGGCWTLIRDDQLCLTERIAELKAQDLRRRNLRGAVLRFGELFAVLDPHLVMEVKPDLAPPSPQKAA